MMVLHESMHSILDPTKKGILNVYPTTIALDTQQFESSLYAILQHSTILQQQLITPFAPIRRVVGVFSAHFIV